MKAQPEYMNEMGTARGWRRICGAILVFLLLSIAMAPVLYEARENNTYIGGEETRQSVITAVIMQQQDRQGVFENIQYASSAGIAGAIVATFHNVISPGVVSTFLWVVVLLFSGIGTFLLFESFTIKPVLAKVVGSIVFTLYLPALSLTIGTGLLYAALLPWIMLSFSRYLRDGRGAWGVLGVVGLLISALGDFSFACMSVIAVALFLLVEQGRRGTSRTGNGIRIRRRFVAVVLCFAFLVTLSVHWGEISQIEQDLSSEEGVTFSELVQRVDENSLDPFEIIAPLHFQSIKYLFLGISYIEAGILLLFVFVRGRKRREMQIGVTTGIMFIFAAGPLLTGREFSIYAPYAALLKISPAFFSSIEPSVFATPVVLCAAFFLALLLQYIWRQECGWIPKTQTSKALLSILVIGCGFFNVLPVTASTFRTPDIWKLQELQEHDASKTHVQIPRTTSKTIAKDFHFSNVFLDIKPYPECMDLNCEHIQTNESPMPRDLLFNVIEDDYMDLIQGENSLHSVFSEENVGGIDIMTHEENNRVIVPERKRETLHTYIQEHLPVASFQKNDKYLHYEIDRDRLKPGSYLEYGDGWGDTRWAGTRSIGRIVTPRSKLIVHQSEDEKMRWLRLRFVPKYERDSLMAVDWSDGERRGQFLISHLTRDVYIPITGRDDQTFTLTGRNAHNGVQTNISVYLQQAELIDRNPDTEGVRVSRTEPVDRDAEWFPQRNSVEDTLVSIPEPILGGGTGQTARYPFINQLYFTRWEYGDVPSKERKPFEQMYSDEQLKEVKEYLYSSTVVDLLENPEKSETENEIISRRSETYEKDTPKHSASSLLSTWLRGEGFTPSVTGWEHVGTATGRNTRTPIIFGTIGDWSVPEDEEHGAQAEIGASLAAWNPSNSSWTGDITGEIQVCNGRTEDFRVFIPGIETGLEIQTKRNTWDTFVLHVSELPSGGHNILPKVSLRSKDVDQGDNCIVKIRNLRATE